MRKIRSISTVHGPMPRTCGEPLDDFRVGHFADGRVGGHGAVQRAGGQVAQRLDLVAGDAGGAQRLVRRIEQELRRGIAAEVLAHAPMDGGRGLAVQLLVEDGLEQRLEGRRRGIEPQREGAGAVDERGQFGVGGLQMRDRLGGIEGKFAAAAVVDHGRSLSQVAEPALDVGKV